MEVGFVGPGLQELDVGVARVAHGLERGAELERADGGAVEERGEDEVRARGDDDGLELFGREAAGEDVACARCLVIGKR